MKIFFLILTSLLPYYLFSQPYNWEVITSATTTTLVTHEDSSGSIAVKVSWNSTLNQDIMSESIMVIPNQIYTYSIDLLDNTNAGRARIAIKWSDGTNDFCSSYTTESAEWQTKTLTGIVPENIESAQLFVRFYDKSEGWEANNNQAEIIIDNASFILDNSTINLAPNANFENWQTTELTQKQIESLFYIENRSVILTSSSIIERVMIFNLAGIKVKELDSHQASQFLYDLDNGLYIICITLKNKKQITSKLTL